jgi:hypothetical protein
MHEVLNKQIADDDGEKADHDFDLVSKRHTSFFFLADAQA